jgi:hypothetical protein
MTQTFLLILSALQCLLLLLLVLRTTKPYNLLDLYSEWKPGWRHAVKLLLSGYALPKGSQLNTVRAWWQGQRRREKQPTPVQASKDVPLEESPEPPAVPLGR